MLDINYNNLTYALVVDKADFYKKNLPEIRKIKSIEDSIKLMLNIPGNRVNIFVSQEQRVYKIAMLTPDIHKAVMGHFVYLPLQKRIDLYTSENLLIPLIQWKEKKVIFKNYSILMDRLGFDKLFSRVINIL